MGGEEKRDKSHDPLEGRVLFQDFPNWSQRKKFSVSLGMRLGIPVSLLLSALPWVNYLTFLSLSFLACKIRTMIVFT